MERDVNSDEESTDDKDGRPEPKRPLRADYGDATAEQVAAAVLRYRRPGGNGSGE
ncbi:MAG: hypothetical protein OXC14_17250 [Rhodospirillaceae bacterium]|nr:hypothetical protein [Rhodospirillaceae bacterium]